METDTGPGEEVEVYRSEDALQEGWPYAAVPSDDNGKRGDDDCL